MPAAHRPVATRDRFVRRFGDRAVRLAEALDAGFSRASLQAAVDRGLLVKPRRGLLSATATGDDHRLAAQHPHQEQLRSALAAVQHGALASHESAAVVHGIATPRPATTGAAQLVAPGRAGFTGPGLVVRCSPVPLQDQTEVDGLRLTTIPRTAVDVARGHRLPDALIPLDSAARILIARALSVEGNALRRAVREPEHRTRALAELGEALGHCAGWSGTVAVKNALQHVDPASESAFESRSRGWFVEAGLGALDPGRPIPCASTTYWADFCSVAHRLIGEADGWSKYGATGREMRAVLEHERARQRDLEADGWRLVRWSTTESRGTVVGRMAAALNRP